MVCVLWGTLFPTPHTRGLRRLNPFQDGVKGGVILLWSAGVKHLQSLILSLVALNSAVFGNHADGIFEGVC
jgi:hypothetical protein